MTLEQHNSQVMYWKNNTAAFIWMCLGPADLKYFWKKACKEEASGEAQKWWKLQANAYQAVLDQKQKADEVQKVNQDTKNAKIDNVELRFDIDSIQKTPGTCEQLDLELEWHQWSDKLIPKKKYILLKINALVAAVECYNEQQVNQVTTLDPDPTAVEAGIQDTEYGDEEDSDLELY
jgi:hypothetical protein